MYMIHSITYIFTGFHFQRVFSGETNPNKHKKSLSLFSEYYSVKPLNDHSPVTKACNGANSSTGGNVALQKISAS